MLTSRSERGRLGGQTNAARHDGRAMNADARRTFRESFLDKVDPDGSLRERDPVEANRRAEAAYKLHFARMAYNSLKARRLKAKKNAALGSEKGGAEEVADAPAISSS
jgi:hypothetical protein